MDLLIPDIWLREFLITKAGSKEIAKYVSLCGPSFERINKTKYGTVYSVEVTTNRVDSASVYGVAREASAILHKSGFPHTKLKPFHVDSNYSFVKNVSYLTAVVSHDLCPRFTAVLIKEVQIKESPDWVKERLESVGVRPINNVVDISNYIMHEIGQPVHTFDYDKIKGSKMILRSSRKGESITTLDGETHSLPGGDIVIEDGKGRLIDLAGIMGGENSAVDKNTKNVLLFVQTYNPTRIRKTSMFLAHRTEAATLFEKGLDTELVKPAILNAVKMFISTTKGKVEKNILDLYPKAYKIKTAKFQLDFIRQRLGVDIAKKEISETLKSLGFEVMWKGNTAEVYIPSFRSTDVCIPEDIVEEVARIHGYHNLPSSLMEGNIPDLLTGSSFDLENNIKNILKGYGGVEIYTLSLVSKNQAGAGALKVKNPLGNESEYLRTSMFESLVFAAESNAGEKDPYHLFEVANVYIPRKNDLPEEKLILAGIFSNTEYQTAKGIVETLLEELNINAVFTPEDSRYFLPSNRVLIKVENKSIGQLGNLEKNDYIYYELNVEEIRKSGRKSTPFKPIPKYPPQIEDITLTFPPKTKIGEVVQSIKLCNKLVSNVELNDIYKDSYTFRIWYQHPDKTLTDKEVEGIRNKILKEIKNKFGGIIKS